MKVFFNKVNIIYFANLSSNLTVIYHAKKLMMYLTRI